MADVQTAVRELYEFAKKLEAEPHSPKLDEYLGQRIYRAMALYGKRAFSAEWDRLTDYEPVVE